MSNRPEPQPLSREERAHYAEVARERRSGTRFGTNDGFIWLRYEATIRDLEARLAAVQAERDAWQGAAEWAEKLRDELAGDEPGFWPVSALNDGLNERLRVARALKDKEPTDG